MLYSINCYLVETRIWSEYIQICTLSIGKEDAVQYSGVFLLDAQQAILQLLDIYHMLCYVDNLIISWEYNTNQINTNQIIINPNKSHK